MTVGVEVRCPAASQFPGRCTYYAGLRSKAPSRKRCAHCGSTLLRTRTVWAPVEWTGTGRYDQPEQTYTTPEIAQAHAVGQQVVRSWSVE